MSEKNNIALGYGAIDDEDASLKGGGNYGKFGLNQNCFFTKFEFNPNAGANGASMDAVDFSIKIEEKEFMKRIFDVDSNRSIYGTNGQLLNPGDPGFDEAIGKAKKQVSAVVIHAVKSLGVTQDQINAAFVNPVNSFREWAIKLISLLPGDYTKRPVDVFLQYQWKISEGQNKTYLEIPKNLKDGKFLCPAIPGTFKEVRDSSGLYYCNEKDNLPHLFTRSSSYLSSNKAVRQTIEEETDSVNINNRTSQASTW